MTTETDWAAVRSGTAVYVWHEDPCETQVSYYIGYIKGHPRPHCARGADRAISCFANAELVVEPETDWAAVRSGTKVVVWCEGDGEKLVSQYIGYRPGFAFPHFVVVNVGDGVGVCFEFAKLAEPETETDWAAVRSGTAVYVWDEDFGDKEVGLYTEYRPGTETPHLAVYGGHGGVGCFTHAKIVGGTE